MGTVVKRVLKAWKAAVVPKSLDGFIKLAHSGNDISSPNRR